MRDIDGEQNGRLLDTFLHEIGTGGSPERKCPMVKIC